MANSTKVAFVTGSNKGIGLAIVRNLCKDFDGDVFLLARDETRGREAVKLLKNEGLEPKFHLLDIESMDSILAFRQFVVDTYGGIDVLVNNAAIAFKQDATEGFGEQAEVTIRVNVKATYNLCKELLPLLRPHARVVNVSSSAGHLSRINGQEPAAGELRKQFSDPEVTSDKILQLVDTFVQLAKDGTRHKNGWPNSTYMVSKVAVSALTRVQQREQDKARPDDDIVINHVHPGYVDTDMTSHKGPLTTEQGAVAPTFLALLPPDVHTNPKGAYFWHDKTEIDWINGPLPAQY